MTTLELTADIGCSECFRFWYVTNVNHCIVPNALIVSWSKSMRSRPDNGKNVRRKHSLQPIAAPLCAVRYCVNYNVSSPGSRRLWFKRMYVITTPSRHVYNLLFSTRASSCQCDFQRLSSVLCKITNLYLKASLCDTLFLK